MMMKNNSEVMLPCDEFCLCLLAGVWSTGSSSPGSALESLAVSLRLAAKGVPARSCVELSYHVRDASAERLHDPPNPRLDLALGYSHSFHRSSNISSFSSCTYHFSLLPVLLSPSSSSHDHYDHAAHLLSHGAAFTQAPPFSLSVSICVGISVMLGAVPFYV